MSKSTRITEEDFDQAVSAVMADFLMDEKYAGKTEAALLFALSGMAFASEVKKIIFREEDKLA